MKAKPSGEFAMNAGKVAFFSASCKSQLLAITAAILVLSCAPFVAADNFEVSSAADTATTGTLRNALLGAQASAGGDIINVTLNAGTIIQVGSALPDLGNAVILSGNGVILDGAGTSGAEAGLVLTGDGSVVGGLQIINFAGNGITITGSFNQVEMCKIGTDGMVNLGNGGHGIEIDGGANNILGGPTALQGNIISATETLANGIYIHGATASGTVVENNKINIREDGQENLGGSYRSAIRVVSAPSTEIGRAGAGNHMWAINVVIEVFGVPTPGAVIQGNALFDPSFPHTYEPDTGIELDSCTDVLIGGPNPEDGNTMKGFRDAAITLRGGCTDIKIQGNSLHSNGFIDQSSGIKVSDSVGVEIGGTLPGAANRIAEYAIAGVSLQAGAQKVQIRRNSIYGNGAMGIQIATSVKVATRPTIDVDFTTGAAIVSGGNNGTVELFADDLDEGETYLTTVSTTGNLYYATLDPAAIRGKRVSATYTTPDGWTSEFSEPAGAPLNRRLTQYYQGDCTLAGKALRFTPVGDSEYTVCQTTSGFESPLVGGVPIVYPLYPDNVLPYTFQNGFTFPFYGQEYTTLYIDRNGAIGLDDFTTYPWSPSAVNGRKRIAGILTWLRPELGGAVTMRELPNRLTVQYQDLESFFGNTGNKNSVQIDLYNTGEIVLSYDKTEAPGFAAGISNGGGLPTDFVPADFLLSPGCAATACLTPCYYPSCSDVPVGATVYDDVIAIYTASALDPFLIDLDGDGLPEAVNASLLDAILDTPSLDSHCCVRDAFEANLAALTPYVTTHVDAFIAALGLQAGTPASDIANFMAGFATWASRDSRLFIFSAIADVLGEPFPIVADSGIRFANGYGDADGDQSCNAGEYNAWVTIPGDLGELAVFLAAVLEPTTVNSVGLSFSCFELPPLRDPSLHAADTDVNHFVSLSELLRVIQFFNSTGYHCADALTDTEDGFVPGLDNAHLACPKHSSDYGPPDWMVDLSELLRAVQFFNSSGYWYCPAFSTEDTYCPGPQPI
jgi:hypothetical protein